MDFDAALAELYQAPHATFVEERKRLSNALKAAGDKAGATALTKRTRPTISVWVVNQLWWHAKDAFTAVMKAAAQLREGDLSASADHRDALAKLRSRATAMLTNAGHAPTESTLRRVMQTLSAIAAAGTWEPDQPGMLTEDRDPPGFDMAMLAPTVAGKGAAAAQKVVALTEAAKKKAHRSVEEAKRARAALEAIGNEPEPEEVEDEEDEDLPAEIPLAPDPKELGSELKAARAKLAELEARAESLRAELASAKEAITEQRRVVDDLQAQLDDAE
jgi:hypothetical protein